MRRPMDILLPKGCGNEEKMSVIEKIFGTHSSRELKRIEPLVDKIEALRPTMQALSDEELRGKTEEYKKRLTEGETLDDLLPEAYATVREAAKRVLNMEHYRVQLIGGIILHQGRIAEMRTGEGKTLVHPARSIWKINIPGNSMRQKQNVCVIWNFLIRIRRICSIRMKKIIAALRMWQWQIGSTDMNMPSR